MENENSAAYRRYQDILSSAEQHAHSGRISEAREELKRYRLTMRKDRASLQGEMDAYKAEGSSITHFLWDSRALSYPELRVLNNRIRRINYLMRKRIRN
ncbi:hypothetical protein FJZ17_01205 [Candidatus Pacearchaeota archaeon]|nr:hypothetical protein [Candidatus Pacearchaeota archaeon]